MVRKVRGTNGTKSLRILRKVHGTNRPRYEKSTNGTKRLWYEKSMVRKVWFPHTAIPASISPLLSAVQLDGDDDNDRWKRKENKKKENKIMMVESFYKTHLWWLHLGLNCQNQYFDVCRHHIEQFLFSALYAIARPSVCPSVTRVDQSKTVEVRITQPSPQSRSMTLV